MDERMQAQAAEAARQLLSDFRAAHPDWRDDRTPVDEVASWHGLEVATFHADDYPEGTYGFFEADENLVWLYRDLSPTFRRFTLAHELGHAVLHHTDGYRTHSQLSIPNSETSREDPCQVPDVREEVTAPTYQQQAEDLLGSGVAYDPRSQRELAANIFAAELLMPLERVRALYLSSHIPPNQLTAIFDVSQAAMLNRLAGLLREPVNLTEQPLPGRPQGSPPPYTTEMPSVYRRGEPCGRPNEGRPDDGYTRIDAHTRSTRSHASLN